jgi:Undecaprenyl-phosphate glucose phosphotransferase
VLKHHPLSLGIVLPLMDAGVMVLAWLLAYWVRFNLAIAPIPVTRGFPEFSTYASLAPLVAVLWMSSFALMRLYESGHLRERSSELHLVLRAHGGALLCFIALTYLFEEYKYSRVVMVYFAALGGVGIVAFRLAVRKAAHHLRAQGFHLRHVLALGEGPSLECFIHKMEAFPELGLRLRGVVTPDGSDVGSVAGHPVIGHFAQLPELLRAGGVDEVLIALPASRNRELEQLLDSLGDETLDVRIVPDVLRHVTLSCDIEDFNGLPIVRLNDSPLVGWGALTKRVTDVVLSATALVVLSPLLGLLAALVKLTSPGPVLFVQERMGLDGRSFPMLKFRSMRSDAESTSGPVWAQAADNRRTAFGTLLRKTSLDELPQLYNVLRGDMALVGPRPERPVFVSQFRNQIPHYMLRHKVKAGITGWAQVNGWRGNTSLDRRIECDLFYIRNWSYALDLKILAMTLWKGFVNENAY